MKGVRRLFSRVEKLAAVFLGGNRFALVVDALQ